MKGIVVLVLLFLLSSCQNKEVVLPQANQTVVADVKDYSPIYFFFKTEEKDTLIDWLKKNPKNNKSYAYKKEVANSKKAILHYEVIKKLQNYFLLEIRLETGRHHQIRSQLYNIGCPIKGDLKYGFDRSNEDGSIHLHARHISFIHPVKKEPVEITAPLPKDKDEYLSYKSELLGFVQARNQRILNSEKKQSAMTLNNKFLGKKYD